MSENKVVPKKRKGRRKKVIAVSLVGVLAAGGIGGALYYKKSTAVKMPEGTKQAQSATAELGSISNTIVGTGNLALADAQSQTIPSGIEIEEVMVETGDQVSKGDTIATVSKASVLKAVEETQEEIQELDDQISECQDDDDTDMIDASVDGRVKLIYAETGDDVTDVMLENGSMLVISLDGKMAVDIKAAGLDEGDNVTVTLSSGTQVTGTVAAVSGSTCTVTMTDNGTTYDDEVTVTDSDGKELGTGNLYIHEPLEITGTTGTVSAVNVSENESVTSGTELLTLENSASEAQYEQLLAQREAYSATLKKLLELSKDQKIKADISGTVQSVNVSAGSSDSSSSSTSSSSAGNSGSVNVSKMSYTVSEEKVNSLKNSSISENRDDNSGSSGNSINGNINIGNINTENVNTENINIGSSSNTKYGAKTASDSQTGIIRLSSAIQTVVGTSYRIINTSSEDSNECEEAETGENVETFAAEQEEEPEIPDSVESTALALNITTAGQSTAGSLVIAVPVTGGTPVGEIAAEDGSYTGSISWNPGDSSFQPETVYQANVTLYAGEGYIFTGSSISGIDTGIVSGANISSDGSTLTFTITYPQTAGKSDSGSGNNSGNASGNDSGEGKDSNSSNGFSDDDNDNNSQSGGETNTGNDSGNASGNGNAGSTGGSSGSGGSASGGTAGSGTQSGSDSVTDSTQTGTSSETSGTSASDSIDITSAYSTDVEAFTISSDENMVLAVSVDELDINSVELGQEATVELDAIEDETFTGEVTAIGDTASASGGVAKYTVSLTIPKDDRMKQGMNASATITIDSRENVVTIPVNALQEEGSKVFVYTEQDADGNLSGEKEVTTGLSNGTTVEITDGLEEGETVYYNKTGNTNSSSGSDGFPGGDFDGGNGGHGGDMPSGSDGGFGGGNDGGTGSGNGGQGGGPGGMPNM